MPKQLLTKVISSSETENQSSFYLETNEALQQAFDSLFSGDFQQRWDVAKILPQFGAIAIKPLQKILLDENEELEIRWFALKILGEFQDVEIILTLVNLLETTEEEELISLASHTFAKQGKQAIEALSNFLMSSSHKFLATKALAQIPSIQVIEPLLSVVTDEDIDVRVMAIQALSNFSDSRITHVLIKALKDNSSRVRKEAVMSLALRAKSHPDLPITSLIAELLYDVNLEVCQKTAIALSRINTSLVTLKLFEVLKTSTTPLPLQITIIRCLGWIETSESLEYLNQALFLVNKTAIIEIITVLGLIKSENLRFQAVKILVNFYESSPLLVKDSLISKSLAYAWGQLGDSRSKKALIEIQKINNKIVKIHANAALKAII